MLVSSVILEWMLFFFGRVFEFLIVFCLFKLNRLILFVDLLLLKLNVIGFFLSLLEFVVDNLLVIVNNLFVLLCGVEL